MTAHPTSSWEAMESVFYRRQQLYNVAGKFPNLGDYHVAGCRRGGPIGLYVYHQIKIYLSSSSFVALIRDSSKLIALGRSGIASKTQVQIYSPAGEGLLLFSVDKYSRLPLTPLLILSFLVGPRKDRPLWVDS
jgi:hypothetical protein